MATCTNVEDTNLWSAADKGDVAKVRELVSLGRDVSSRNCLGCTPLLYACGSGHTETVSRVSINISTPLHNFSL